jgi:hypothetical protein
VYRPLQFHQRSQYFIGTHNETLSVAMRVQNPDCPPFTVNGRNAAPTPTGFAQTYQRLAGARNETLPQNLPKAIIGHPERNEQRLY